MVDEKDRELFEIRSKMIEMSKALKTSQVRMDKEIPNCQIEEEAEGKPLTAKTTFKTRPVDTIFKDPLKVPTATFHNPSLPVLWT
jgi:hypothetical protein